MVIFLILRLEIENKTKYNETTTNNNFLSNVQRPKTYTDHRKKEKDKKCLSHHRQFRHFLKNRKIKLTFLFLSIVQYSPS